MPLPKTKSQLEIEKLWSFEGRDASFWVELLRVFSRQLEAASGMVLIELKDDRENSQWSPIAVYPESEETRQRLAGQKEALFSMASDLDENTGQLIVHEVDQGIWGAVLPLRVENCEAACVATFIRYGSEDFFRPAERIERLMMDTPLIYGANPFAGTDESDSADLDSGSALATALTLGLLVNDENRFLTAGMVLCNELAARFSADRVSLGWVRGHYLRLKATNHVEKINRKMEVSRLLEAAMEECLDQDDEILWPGAGNAAAIERDHERYARKVGIANLASVPLRDDHEPVAAITLERVEPFTDADLQSLRLAADLCVRRLADLHETDRWFGARWAASFRRGLAKVIGFEHTWVKLGVLTAVGVLAFLAFYPWDFKVKASFILQPDQVYHIPAPFDGYIKTVEVEAGDEVAEQESLVLMDISELELNKAELAATVQRFVSEAQLARSEATPAQMHIAIAKAEETKAALQKVQFNLDMATVKAPEKGVVLEGDIRDRIGSPVTRGEALLKLSPLEGMYAELRLPENEATRVSTGSIGEAAFESRPEERFPIVVTGIEPLAVPEEKGNMLIIRTSFSDDPAPWWRPGMSGVVKIDCGKRPLLWIFTRRAVDYLRMRFWF